jgi:hypothetical protein
VIRLAVEANRLEERVLLAGGQISPGTDGQSGDIERPDTHPAQALDGDTHHLHDVADEVIRPFVDHHFQDEPFRRLAKDAKLFRNDAVPIDDYPVAHPLQHALGRPCQRQDVVLLVEFVARMHDPVGDVAVVGQQEEPLGVAIETTHWVDPFRDLHDVHDGAPVAFVLRRRDKAARFVEDEIARSLRTKQLPVDPDLGANGVGFRTQLGHDLAVDAHPTRGDQRLCGSPRGDAAGGQDPL